MEKNQKAVRFSLKKLIIEFMPKKVRIPTPLRKLTNNENLRPVLDCQLDR